MRVRSTPLALAAAFLLAACSGTATVPIGDGSGGSGTNGTVLLLNALGTGSSASLRVDGATTTLPAAGTARALTLSQGTHQLEATGSGGQTLASATVSVAADVHRSVVLSGSAGNVSLLVSAIDTAQVPLSDAIKARLVHTVQNAPAMDAYLFLTSQAADSGARVLTNFTYGVGTDPEFPGYVVRPPGEYLVWLKAAGTDNVLLQAGPVTLTAGHVYSFVLALNDAGEMELRTVVEQ